MSAAAPAAGATKREKKSRLDREARDWLYVCAGDSEKWERRFCILSGKETGRTVTVSLNLQVCSLVCFVLVFCWALRSADPLPPPAKKTPCLPSKSLGRKT
jgi:hypothetical protein